MGRLRSSEKLGLKKGPWTPEEDRKLMAYIAEHGHGSWRTLPAKAGLQRCGKSCRLRWINYLSPHIKRGDFSLWEEQTIIQLHALIGNRWSRIAAHLPKRTDNEIKNYWNSHLKKRLIRIGIDPTTHRPKTDAVSSKGAASNLRHVAQWENIRLEAEARLASKPGSSSSQPPAQLVLGRIPARPSLPPCLDVLQALQSPFAKPPNPEANNIMHSMYAIMLTTADDLELPTSTLSFPGNQLPIPTTLAQTTTIAPAAAAVVDFTKSLAACDGRMFGEAIENKSWKYLEKENLDDHDTTLSMEKAFTITTVRCENVPDILPTNAMEGPSNQMSIYYSDEIHLAEGNMRTGNEDNVNHCYWNSLLNVVNDFESGSQLF